MANDNETVGEIANELRDEPLTENGGKPWLHYLADRIEAAHRREIMELKNKCEEYERQPELTAETAKAALELIKAQESKIAELRECLRMAVVNTRIDRTCRAFGRECDTCGQSCDARKWNKVIEATKGANNDNSSCQNH